MPLASAHGAERQCRHDLHSRLLPRRRNRRACAGALTVATIDSLDALRAQYRDPKELARRKVIDRLDAHCRTFIAHAPFLVIGTAGANGGPGDVSPRGDRPGFVHVADDRTILIPDRPGNNRLDTLSNILENPEVAAIFMIPGFEETLRLNGRASLTDDPDLMERLAMGGKPALMAIRVAVREAYIHCNRALRRARLWDEANKPDRSILPGGGRMAHEMAGLSGDPEEADRTYNEGTRKLY